MRKIGYTPIELTKKGTLLEHCDSYSIENNTSEISMLTVYFDGRCGLCSKEIEIYKRADKNGLIHWHDLTASESNLEGENFNLIDALKLLHVKGNDGEIHVGVEAFIVIWRHLPRWRLLSILASPPPVTWVLQIAYQWFAKRRFSRSQYCQSIAKMGD